MATTVFFDSFLAASMNGVHDLASDDLKLALSNAAPSASTDTQFSDITEIAAGNGYTAGGQSLDNVLSTQTAGVYTLTADDEFFTAAGGTMATFQYFILYNDTATNNELIAYWALGAAKSLEDGKAIKYDIGTSIFTLQ